jgi:hypothetical protein
VAWTPRSACPGEKLYISAGRIDRSPVRDLDANNDAALLLDDRSSAVERTEGGGELPPNSGVNLTL